MKTTLSMKTCHRLLAACVLMAATPAWSAQMHSPIFHAFRLQVDGTGNDKGGLVNWEGHGWIGGDLDKLVIKTEGEMQNGHVEHSELWGLWSRNISDFWDLQTGIRQDFDPRPTSALVIGFQGMLPQFIETDLHGFVSSRGDVAARLEQTIDLAITQRLILEPHVKMDIHASDVSELEIGSGISKIELGTKLRYEITRKIAPYIDLVYETATGNTAHIKRNNGEDPDDLTLRVGLSLAF